jgi:hypothetical protein
MTIENIFRADYFRRKSKFGLLLVYFTYLNKFIMYRLTYFNFIC